MNGKDISQTIRYQRQITCRFIGPEGQRKLLASKVLIVGVGGLGSWAAELLARAGVGFLRLADNDKVDITNIHRQAMYNQADAEAGKPKAIAAAEHIRQINSGVTVEPIVARLDRNNIADLAAGVDLIIDGTDNFPSRFIINDYCIKHSLAWIFAGVVQAEAQTMTIIPHRTPCLRCVYDSPPPPCADPSCRVAGVLGPAVAAIASIETMEAIKILSGNAEAASPYLTKMDLWTNQIQRIELPQACAKVNCPCCKQNIFEFLEP